MNQNLFETWQAERAAKTSQEWHGSGVLTLFDGRPVRASGCLMDDGALVEARCIAWGGEDHVWARSLGDTRLRRRGRLIVEAGAALRFIDEPAVDLLQQRPARARDLAADLAMSPRLRAGVQSNLFAGLLYAALCQTEWRHKDATPAAWRCSWREAGAIVAGLRGEGDYSSWYCWGCEGTIDEAVLLELEALGWSPASLAPDP
jgi:hypothetical protein